MNPKFNPAMGFVPNVKNAQVTCPAYKELSESNWTHQINNDPLSFLLPANQQSPNYTDLNEAYQTSGIKQYGMGTGQEPVFGQYKFPIELYKNNNDALTRSGLEVLSNTRITAPFVDDKFAMKPVSKYPISPFIIDFVGGGNLLM